MRNIISITTWTACFLLFSCNYEQKESPQEQVIEVKDTSIVLPSCAMEDSLIAMGLVNIQSINPSIKVELRYANTNNFLGIKLYDCLANAYLQKEVALKLDTAQQILSSLYPGYKLYIWDAVRPKSVQQRMWDSLKLPLEQKFKYVSNPKNHSVHNYGAAVDLTIQDSIGNLLDMGTDFDYFGPAANVHIDSFNLANKNLTIAQIKNRKLLRKCMYKAGFTGINSEWWHYNAYSRETTKSKYKLLH